MIDFLNSLNQFILTVGAVLLALIIMKIIEEAADKHVSIFQTWSRPRLYELSFIYPLARDMKLQGMSDDDIIDELVYRYDNKRLAIQQYEPKKKEYQEAIAFVGKVLRDREIMKKYILTSSFGKKTFKELEKEIAAKSDDDDSHQKSQESNTIANKTDEVLLDTNFLGKVLKDDSPVNRNYALDWLSALFSMPVEDPSGKKMHKSAICNFLAVHIALSSPCKDGGEDGYFVFKNCLPEVDLLSALEQLKEIHPEIKMPSYTSNNYQYRGKVMDNKEWIQAIREMVLSSIPSKTKTDGESEE